ncbi:ABC transporter [Sphaerisporangium krabiense]|uniref:Transport permease protein n=1 Tax=Sphaerisporangium krabiense TaxID=763782 RepID=A0A7W8ZBN7_9ACTN|nr:ABC transporter permease [Sphaerisporangium krabiense]MBB5631062.1 ABC-2 type transport system permease protein [Sphaerisporangium krabiense]GII65945.1 ABC transporter [Sphaerisporangium krabiense]
MPNTMPNPIPAGPAPAAVTGRAPNPFPRYVRLEALRMLRNKRYAIFVVAFPVGLYLLYANLWGGEVDEASGLRTSVLLMVSMAAYGALAASIMSTAVPWSQERQAGWLRQLQVTPLRGRTVIATKLVSSLLLVLPALVLVVAAAVLTQHVTLPAGRWAALIAVMWAGTVPFAALGLIIGSLARPDTAQPLAIAGMFGLALLGGLWFPVDMLPDALGAVARALPSYDYADIGRQIVAGGAPHARAVGGILAWSAALCALAVLAYRRATARG